MTWVKKPVPIVPSLENYDVQTAKRLTDIYLTDLITHREEWIKWKMRELGITHIERAISFVIVKIDYPFWLFIPTDKHTWNAFNGKACFTIDLDYWQTAEETLMTYILNSKLYGKHGYGDCEDSSILLTAFLRFLNIPAYEVFGIVYQNNMVLGGHGWTIAKFPEDNKWHLIETTLDTPPKYPDGYPVIDPDTNEWVVGNLVYEGWIKFNEKEYFEWEKKRQKKSLELYAKLNKKHKHSKKKYKAIAEAWNIKTKLI